MTKKFDELAEFINHRMRMSHIYQPVMLATLLRQQGTCTERTIAKALLTRDESQIEYYVKITNNMVGRVLRNHKLVEKDRKTKTYELSGFGQLSEAEIHRLVELCEERLNRFLEARGKKIFAHRRKSAGYVSGTLKYEVLKRARFHCELCGIPADEKALEVDHIIPRNHGGSDDPSNLQALCYSCNAMKRDRDDTDFRAVRKSYKERADGCPFCELPEERIALRNPLAVVVRDAYPVVENHILIIPKRHVASYFDLGQSEINACNALIKQAKSEIEKIDQSADGFNIGVNDGAVAGQTVSHCHIHLIPRRNGDVPNPRGGVRNTIPGKGDYTVA